MTGNGTRIRTEPITTMVGGLAEFGNDVSTLAELQAKLALLDMKESARRAAVPSALIVVGVALATASLPVALIGVSELVATALQLAHRGWAYLIVAGVTLLIAILIAAVAGSRLGHSFESFQRSRDELTRNIAWLRTVLLHSGRGPARFRR